MKRYVKPSTMVVLMETERLLSASFDIDNENGADAEDSFVRPMFTRPLEPYKGHVFSE